MGGLAGPVGFDAADGLAGGPPDGPGVLVVEVDGDGLGGDVDGDDLPGVDAAERDLLAGHHDHAGVAGPALGGDRLAGRAGRPSSSVSIVRLAAAASRAA